MFGKDQGTNRPEPVTADEIREMLRNLAYRSEEARHILQKLITRWKSEFVDLVKL